MEFQWIKISSRFPERIRGEHDNDSVLPFIDRLKLGRRRLASDIPGIFPD
jgi:hypothetical protein